MSQPLVVVLDPMAGDDDLERSVLEDRGYRLEQLVADPTQRAQQLGEAVAVLATDGAISEDLLAATPHCRVAATYGVGYDNIDVTAARRAGVVVTNVPDYCTEEVADHAFALILALLRRTVTGDAMVRDGRWTLEPFLGIRRIRGLRLGLIGLGRIGSAVAARAVPFGFTIRAVDPWFTGPSPASVQFGSLHEVIAASDVVSIHAPLTADTRGLIGGQEIAQMPSSALLVNTARGGILDLGAALSALDEGRLGGLGLDVYPDEPVAADLFRGRPNVIATPHTAFYSVEAMNEGRRSAASTIADVLDGLEVPNRVA